MFLVSFIKSYDSPFVLNLNSVARIISLNGFESPNYAPIVSQNGFQMVSSSFIFQPRPFSVVLFVAASSRSEFQSKIAQILSAFRQYRRADFEQMFAITNQETGAQHLAPVIIENVSITQQAGLSATITITGVRRTQGLFRGGSNTEISVSATTSGLPKTVSLNYPYSFPTPLRIALTGPITSGFQISRNEAQPRFDFILTVGSSIPSGVTVSFDYRFAYETGDGLVSNIRYLANPEIVPDITVRPQTVTGSPINNFTLSGPSSSGTVSFTTNPMSWSIYE